MQTSSVAVSASGSRQSWWGSALGLAGIALLVYSQFFCVTQPEEMALGRLIASRVAAIGLLAAAVCLFLQGGVLPWFARREPAAEQERVKERIGWRQVGAVAAGLLLSIGAGGLAGTDWQAVSPYGSVLLWTYAIILVVWAGWQGSFSRAQAPRGFWLAALVVLAAALLVRLISLQTIPVIFTGDESGFGMAAQQIRRGEITNLFSAPFMGATNMPLLYDMIQAGALGLFGRSAWALRITSALAGGLTVLAVVYFGLRWFDRRTAVFSALILAGSHLHLHFSRYAVNNVFDGLFFVLVIGLLWDAWDSGERKKYLLAGLALGFSQYFYISARALPLAVLAFFAAGFLLERKRFKAARASIVFFWAAFLVVFLPMIFYYIEYPYTFITPLNRVGQDAVKAGGLLSAFSSQNLPATLVQLYNGLLGFTILPLQWLYKPGVAILRPMPALLFLFGLAALLARRRWSQILLLGLWLAAFGFIGGLSDATPAAQRYVAAVPALALLAGYALSTAADLLARFWPARARVFTVLALLLALIAATDDARFYFFYYTVKERYADPNGLAVQQLSDYLRAKDSDTQVVFVSYPGMEYTSIPTPAFFNPQIHEVVSIHGPEELDAVLQPPSSPRVYFFTMGFDEDVQRVMHVLPGGKLTSESNQFGEPVYWIYEVAP